MWNFIIPRSDRFYHFRYRCVALNWFRFISIEIQFPFRRSYLRSHRSLTSWKYFFIFHLNFSAINNDSWEQNCLRFPTWRRRMRGRNRWPTSYRNGFEIAAKLPKLTVGLIPLCHSKSCRYKWVKSYPLQVEQGCSLLWLTPIAQSRDNHQGCNRNNA